nr:hypothetical protein [Tanacetum cinerariifolium]
MAQAGRLSLRMQKELKLLLTDPASFSLTSIHALIQGLEGTDYENGVFKIDIQIRERCPFQPPVVTFRVVINLYRFNTTLAVIECLDSETGRVIGGFISVWKKTKKVYNALMESVGAKELLYEKIGNFKDRFLVPWEFIDGNDGATSDNLENCFLVKNSLCFDCVRVLAQKALLSLKSIPVAARRSLPVLVNPEGQLYFQKCHKRMCTGHGETQQNRGGMPGCGAAGNHFCRIFDNGTTCIWKRKHEMQFQLTILRKGDRWFYLGLGMCHFFNQGQLKKTKKVCNALMESVGAKELLHEKIGNFKDRFLVPWEFIDGNDGEVSKNLINHLKSQKETLEKEINEIKLGKMSLEGGTDFRPLSMGIPSFMIQ